MSASLNLTESSPIQTFTEPLTLSEVKDFLRLTASETTDDAMLTRFIPAARNVAEIFQGRDLIRKQWDLTLDYFYGYSAAMVGYGYMGGMYPQAGVIELREPLVSVDLVQYKAADGTVTPLSQNTDFIVDATKRPGIITPVYGASWPSFTPWPAGGVLIRFTSGMSPTAAFWGDAGARLKMGMLYLISAWYNGGLPFEVARGTMAEYPFSVTANLGYGSIPRIA